jgi:predicted MFS family arabinose efflux permease
MRRIHMSNPWWSVFGSSAALTVCQTNLIAGGTASLFIKPISEQFGWSRTVVSGAISLGFVTAALAQPAIGAIVDRWGIRRIQPWLIAAFAGSLVLLSRTPGSIVIFLILFGLVGVASAAQTSVPYINVIARSFDRRLGLAIGFVLAGVGIGLALIPTYAQQLISHVGWRGAYLGLAALLAIALISVLLFISEPDIRPHAPTTPRPATPSTEPGLTVREALRTRPFWLILMAVCLISIPTNGAITQLAPLLTDRGVKAADVASLLFGYGTASLVIRPVIGHLYDRLFAPCVAAAVLVLPLAGLLLLSFGATPLIAVVVLGFMSGTEFDMLGFLASRYFGRRHFGKLMALVVCVFMLSAAVGPVGMAYSYDVLGSYQPVLLVGAALMPVAAGLLLALGPYRYPAKEGPGRRTPGSVKRGGHLLGAADGQQSHLG